MDSKNKTRSITQNLEVNNVAPPPPETTYSGTNNEAEKAIDYHFDEGFSPDTEQNYDSAVPLLFTDQVTSTETGSTSFSPLPLHFLPTSSDETSESVYKCNICEASFTQKGLLGFHYRTVHPGKAPFKCGTCQRTFGFAENLKLHERFCKTEEPITSFPFCCEICGKGFSVPFKLNRHMRHVHLKIRKHLCDICGDGFKDSSALRGHRAAVHLRIRFPCSAASCGKVCSTQWLWKQHEKTCVHLQKIVQSQGEIGGSYNPSASNATFH